MDERKKKIRAAIFRAAAAAAFLCAAYLAIHHFGASRDMVTVNLQEIEIVPGRTTVQELLDAGFELAERRAEDTLGPEVRAEANSYYTLLLLVKDQERYGLVTVANDTSREQPIPKCKILNITVYDTDGYGGKAEADGVAMYELTFEKLKSRYGEPCASEDNVYIGGTNVEWENRGYYFRVNIGEDGNVHYMQSAYGHH